MASRERNRNFLRSIFNEDRVIEAMLEGDCDQCILKAGHSILNKCGNCQYRFKCGTDMIEIFRHRTDLLDKLGLGDVDSAMLMKIIDKTYQFIEENVEESKIFSFMYEIQQMSGIDPLQFISSLDEVFGKCTVHQKVKMIQEVEE